MSKICEIPIAAVLAGTVPQSLTWGGHVRHVRSILSAWRETGYWWEGEHEKDFYRVECDQGQYDIYRDRETGEWFLYRILE